MKKIFIYVVERNSFMLSKYTDSFNIVFVCCTSSTNIDKRYTKKKDVIYATVHMPGMNNSMNI